MARDRRAHFWGMPFPKHMPRRQLEPRRFYVPFSLRFQEATPEEDSGDKAWLAKMFLVDPKQSLQGPNQELELTRFQVWVFDQAVDGFRNLFEMLGRKDRQMEKLKPILKMRCVHAHMKYLCMGDFHAMWVYSKVPCARKGAATMPV